MVSILEKMNPFCWVKEKALKSDFCRSCISKFNVDPGNENYQGITLGGLSDVKKSRDLQVSQSNYWKEEDKVFFNSLTVAIAEYKEVLARRLNLKTFPERGGWQVQPDPFYKGINDKGYQIQKTLPGDFYDWHHDFLCDSSIGGRRITYLWYLNDIAQGGETEFFDGTRITPKEGSLLLFPAEWSFYHRGRPPKHQIKYICTGWIYS